MTSAFRSARTRDLSKQLFSIDLSEQLFSMFNMASSRLTDELFERALSDSLKDFPHIPCLKEEQKLTIRGRQKGCVWNSSHRIRQKSDLSIATSIIQRIVEIEKNDGPGRNSSGCHHERLGRGNEPFRIESVWYRLGRRTIRT